MTTTNDLLVNNHSAHYPVGRIHSPCMIQGDNPRIPFSRIVQFKNLSDIQSFLGQSRMWLEMEIYRPKKDKPCAPTHLTYNGGIRTG